MSHYSSVKLKVKNRATLVKALQKIGNGKWSNCVESHDQATNLYGYKGDKRPETAEIIIRRQNVGNASNDIGFKKQQDGTYQAIISEFDSRSYNQQWLDSLSQEYAKLTIYDVANQYGWSTETIQNKNEITITCTGGF